MGAKKLKPPVEETGGHRAEAGYVKAHPENNRFYLEQYTDWEFYSILEWLDRELESLIPGYNISQIKLKFDELRYYFDYPQVIPVKPEWPSYDSEEKIKAMVKGKITFAEGYVSGFLAAKRVTS